MSNIKQVNESTNNVNNSQILEEKPRVTPFLKLGLALVMVCLTCIYLYYINKSEDILPSNFDTPNYPQLALQTEQTNQNI